MKSRQETAEAKREKPRNGPPVIVKDKITSE
jgi:hypothetical protein